MNVERGIGNKMRMKKVFIFTWIRSIKSRMKGKPVPPQTDSRLTVTIRVDRLRLRPLNARLSETETD